MENCIFLIEGEDCINFLSTKVGNHDCSYDYDLWLIFKTIDWNNEHSWAEVSTVWVQMKKALLSLYAIDVSIYKADEKNAIIKIKLQNLIFPAKSSCLCSASHLLVCLLACLLACLAFAY